MLCHSDVCLLLMLSVTSVLSWRNVTTSPSWRWSWTRWRPELRRPTADWGPTNDCSKKARWPSRTELKCSWNRNRGVREPNARKPLRRSAQVSKRERWLGVVVVTASDLWSTSCEFDSRPCTTKLVLGWVTVCGRTKHLGRPTSLLGQLSLPSLRGRWIESGWG